MRLALLEYNMGLFTFGIFAGMIIALILMCIWGMFKKDDDNERINKTLRERNNGVGINNINNDREYRSNNYDNYRESGTEEIIEDLIICDILGLF